MTGGRFITGWAEVTVTGAEPERFLNALADHGILFWNAAPPADFALRVRVPAGQGERAAKLAPAAGCEGRVTARGGLPRLFGHARRRVTIAAVLLGALCLLLMSLSRIWDIRVEGNETVPEGVIRQALAECGVDIGARWVGMSQDGVRNGVILRVPELRWMTVTMEGCRARVIVRERQTYIEPVPEGEYARIVAEKAGFVTAVYPKRGTAEAEVNRVVLPGETIIGGYATGRFGVQGPVRAIGSARVRTWYELTAAAPAELRVKERTGGVRTLFSLVFGKTRINFYKGSSICPGDCDKIIKRYALGAGSAFGLPLAVEKTVLTGYGAKAAPGAELPGELEGYLMEELSRRIGEDGEVLSADFRVTESEGILYVTLRAECGETIGTAVPLTEEELRAIEAKIPRTEDQST